MVSEETFESLLDPTKKLTTPRTHRRIEHSNARLYVVSLTLALVGAWFLVQSLPLDNARKPLSLPYTAETYAPHTFPTVPYVEPPEATTAGGSTPADAARESDRAARTERKTVSKVEIVISFALAQQGKRYSFGTKGPTTYDCSGLVLRAFAQIGVSLYHYTGEMLKRGVSVARSNLQRGDLIFPAQNHVGIYLGGNEFVHASSGKGKVVVAKVSAIYAIRRIV